MDRSFQYHSHIQEIPRIRKDLEFLKTEWSISASEIRQILVIIEELFSNIIRYAFEDRQEHTVEITLGFRVSQIEIRITDDGIPFNPLEYKMGAVTDPASSDSGGMGLTLVRAFSTSVSYQRDYGKNHLKITKSIKGK